MVITNPPFSLLREFIEWCMQPNLRCCVLGNSNTATSKAIFPHVASGQLWLGTSITSGDREFKVPEHYPLAAAKCRIGSDGQRRIRVKGVRWYTNIRRIPKKPLQLHTMEWNRTNSKHQSIRDHGYPQFDHYDAINVGFVDAIPSDYEGVMGVPVTFLDRFDSQRFELLDACNRYAVLDLLGRNDTIQSLRSYGTNIDGKPTYSRLHIRHR